MKEITGSRIINGVFVFDITQDNGNEGVEFPKGVLKVRVIDHIAEQIREYSRNVGSKRWHLHRVAPLIKEG